MHRTQQVRHLVAVVGLVVTVSVCTLAFSGCAGSATESGSIDGSWKLVGGTDARGAISLHHVRVTLNIDGSNSNGDGPCNAYSAIFSSTVSGALSIKRAVTTTMACVKESRNVLESRYFRDLDNIDTAHLNQGDLWLVGSNASLEFVRAKH
jgi:heat shock protein HslJ